MTESSSADFLAAIESYWTGSHLEFYQASTTEHLCQNMKSAFMIGLMVVMLMIFYTCDELVLGGADLILKNSYGI